MQLFLKIHFTLFVWFSESNILILCTKSSWSKVKLDRQEAVRFNTQTEKSKSRPLLEPTLCTSYTYYNTDCSPTKDGSVKLSFAIINTDAVFPPGNITHHPHPHRHQTAVLILSYLTKRLHTQLFFTPPYNLQLCLNLKFVNEHRCRCGRSRW